MGEKLRVLREEWRDKIIIWNGRNINGLEILGSNKDPINLVGLKCRCQQSKQVHVSSPATFIYFSAEELYLTSV